MERLVDSLLQRGQDFVRYFPLPRTNIAPNPLLDYELKRLGYNQTSLSHSVMSDVMQLIDKMGCQFPALLSIFGCFVLLNLQGATFAALLVFTSCFNVYYMLIPLQSLGRQTSSPDWDTVKVTMLSANDILLTQFTIGLLRVWNATAIETGIRLFLAVPFLCATLFGSLYTTDLRTAPFTFLSYVPLIGIFVLEPRWRTRSLTALSIAISDRIMDTTSPMRATLAVGITFSIALAAVLSSGFPIIQQLVSDLQARVLQIVPINNTDRLILHSLLEIVVYLVATAGVHAGYNLITRVSLNRARLHSARSA
jgi:hypothetical protein